MSPVHDAPAAGARDGGRGAAIAVGLLVAASALLMFPSAELPAAAFAPLALLAGAAVLAFVPVRSILLTLVGIGLILDAPAAKPAAGKWQSPLYPLGELLYSNLNSVTGIGALRFALIEALLAFLVVRVLVSRAAGARAAREAHEATPAVLTWALAAWLGALAWFEVWGVARGGDVQQSLWQIRQLLWVPIVAWLMAAVMRGPDDFRIIARWIIVAAVVKVALGLYFLLAIARPRGLDPAYVTSHDDTVLFAVAVLICIAAWVYRPSRGHVLLLATVVPWTLLGIQINNRRLAFVALFAALIVLYAVLGGRTKRAITMAAICLAPVFAGYLLVGQHRSGKLFAPAVKIMSVVTQTDASSGTRDIENYNLYVTLRAKGRLLGSGFGHEYVEAVRAYDISQGFAQYLYIAHNSVLWLWSIGGLIGITVMWSALVVGVYLAARAFHAARTPMQRTAAVTVIGSVLIYLVQAWGDMGTQTWVAVWILGSMLAVAGRLAAATGQWPAGVPLLARPSARRVPTEAPAA